MRSGGEENAELLEDLDDRGPRNGHHLIGEDLSKSTEPLDWVIFLLQERTKDGTSARDILPKENHWLVGGVTEIKRASLTTHRVLLPLGLIVGLNPGLSPIVEFLARISICTGRAPLPSQQVAMTPVNTSAKNECVAATAAPVLAQSATLRENALRAGWRIDLSLGDCS
ncbi:unnamed protein product, partial [Clonostachys rosea f. rosea IK726]